MASNDVDVIHYVRLPGGMGGRAEMVRMTYVLAGRPYKDELSDFGSARAAVEGKNPFLQFPYVITTDGRAIYQALAIMHHAAHGTRAWPSEPDVLTDALSVAMASYDLYQHFGGFAATDEAAKKRFEERRAPQFFGGLDHVYAGRAFAVGSVPTFADCLAHQAVAWCVRKNDACRGLLAEKKNLAAFMARFEAHAPIAAFMEKQRQARAADDSV
jgi:glutathione S-transferase